ncbi:alanine racemase [Planctomicrobium sp. SH527]|uniref:alanine racemase n=1 Tax=Planctomicrobium sp. SH527 TaxID=3448123 RepID=UPI003F5C1BB9
MIPDTPALCLDLNHLELRFAEVGALCSQHQKKWFPGGDEVILPAIQELALSSGACGFTAPPSFQLHSHRFSLAQFDHNTCALIASDIVVTPPQLAQYSNLSRDFDLTFICDHFAQAELISELGQKLNKQLPILIEINIGQNQYGARPGPDAWDLATGIATLPSVYIAGASGNLGHIDASESHDSKRIHSQVNLLTKLTRTLAHQSGRVSIAASGNIRPLFDIPEITEIRTETLLESSDFSMPLETAAPSNIFVMATVVSRPTLERAILNAGRLTLGDGVLENAVRATSFGRPLPDATVTGISDHSLILQLGPESQDLIIGDQVQVVPFSGTMAFRLSRTIHGMKNLGLEWTWAR